MAAELTYDVGGAAGNREDLKDVISSLRPSDTWLYSGLGHTEASATYHEWMIDSLQAAAQNAALEGGDFSEDTINQPSRTGNFTQINKKQVKISGTQEAVRKAGRSSDYEYHKTKKTAEMMRDIEFTLMQGTVATGNSAAARGSKGVVSWITTNVDTASANRALALNGAAGTGSVNQVLKSVFDAGGVPDVAYMSSGLAGTFANLTSGSGDYRRIAPNPKELQNVVTYYTSPFDNQIELRVHRYIPTGTVVFLESDYWKVAQLRAPFHEMLAKSGDSVRGQVISELTLEALQEKSSGKITNVV